MSASCQVTEVPAYCPPVASAMHASLFLLCGSVVVAHCPCLFVFGHEHSGLLQGVALLGGYALIAALCEFAGVSVGHSEDVVCLDSLVSARVAWDWFPEGESFLFLFNSVENFVGLVQRLALVLLQVNSTWSVVVESSSILGEVLVVHHLVVLGVASIELSNGHWVDWLLQTK